ncbi:hypothetical protein K505DRAFT_20349 [Melanomma pulvis-pyrius CBS 109.77]|uniref:Uncharacterized protein n=1 Tax=Melanomma pulvis-pyrius CBS 109.77 TaxID=1314802 RepID=A0A6A6XEM5_9PLEO|nr:hypothetical protein K505DRAFT_20349 [Melanomma pulvis-pyrius CBS 109.77]
MAARPLPVSVALPSSPRSPTLSDAGMILPEADPLRSYSPNPYIERPPSPPSLLYAHSNRSAHTIKLGSAPQTWRGPTPPVRSPPLSAQSSRSTLRIMADSGAAPKTPGANNDNLASSPTIQDALSSHPPNSWGGQPQQQRRFSNTSSSVHSDDLENIKWPGFAEPANFDDSGVVLEDEEEQDHFPVDVRGDDDIENDGWMDEQSDPEDDDMYSSAALSRRAEIILANAKKRLNVMEGNLRGARQSLVVSPSFNHTAKMAPELPHPLSALRDRDRRLYAGMGPIAPRIRPFYSSPLSSNNNSPGHSRVLSETSAQVSFSPTHMNRMMLNKRATSAMGTASGPWSPEGYGQGRFPIRESRSVEVMREPKSNGWGNNEDRDPSLHAYSRGSRSPPNTLETLPEDGSPKLHRSASAASDLRDQMKDLKGRISSLKQRAKEDNLRRRSLQSLRTPSPFTSAETWYSEAETYKNGGSPVTADGGVGIKTESPTRKALYEDEQVDSSIPQISSVETSTRQMEPPQENTHTAMPLKSPLSPDYPASQYDDAQDTQYVEPPANTGEIEDGLDEMDENDFVSIYGEDLEPAGNSVYEDAVYEMPVAERHEDRVDAFDYENFFLHSAMGTYSSGSRRSSSSSADSVATTRPVVPVDSSTKRVSYHQRNSSMDSVSTMASFATAAEEQSDDEEEENEQMDQFSQQLLPQTVAPRHTALHGYMSPRSDSAINMGKANGSPTLASPTQASRTSSRGSSPAGDLASGLQTSKIFSILTESHAQDEPRLALNEEEKQLIYSLAASFQQVCAHLQSTSGDQYERKEWRRRLDEARRLLNGENLEGQLF